MLSFHDSIDPEKPQGRPLAALGPLFAIDGNGSGHKVCRARAVAVQGLPEPVIGGIHLAQSGQNFFGAGVVVVGDELPPLPHQCLGLRVPGVPLAQSAEAGEDGRHGLILGGKVRLGVPGGARLALSVGIGPAPAFLYLRRVLVNMGGVKFLKTHRSDSAYQTK